MASSDNPVAQAHRYVRLGRIGILLMFVGFFSAFIAASALRLGLGWNSSLGLVLGMGLFVLGMILALRAYQLFRRLRCPACQQNLTNDPKNLQNRTYKHLQNFTLTR